MMLLLVEATVDMMATRTERQFLVKDPSKKVPVEEEMAEAAPAAFSAAFQNLKSSTVSMERSPQEHDLLARQMGMTRQQYEQWLQQQAANAVPLAQQLPQKCCPSTPTTVFGVSQKLQSHSQCWSVKMIVFQKVNLLQCCLTSPNSLDADASMFSEWAPPRHICEVCKYTIHRTKWTWILFDACEAFLLRDEHQHQIASYGKNIY